MTQPQQEGRQSRPLEWEYPPAHTLPGIITIAGDDIDRFQSTIVLERFHCLDDGREDDGTTLVESLDGALVLSAGYL